MEWPESKTQKALAAGENVMGKNSHSLQVSVQGGADTFEDSLADFRKTKRVNYVIYWWHCLVFTQMCWRLVSPQNVLTRFCSSFVHDWQDLEAERWSIKPGKDMEETGSYCWVEEARGLYIVWFQLCNIPENAEWWRQWIIHGWLQIKAAGWREKQIGWT